MRLTQLAGAIALSLTSIVELGAQTPAPTALSGPLRSHLTGERFQVVTSIRGMPLGVRDALQELFGGQLLEMASAGTNSAGNSTLADPSLPIPRLLLAGCATDHCVVYYEHRGAWHVALFNWTPAATRLELNRAAPQGLASIDDVRKVVLSR